MKDTVIFSADPADSLRKFFSGKKYSKVAVLLDNNTAELCYPHVQPGLPAHSIITVANGEEFKNLETCAIVWEKMTQAKLDRHSLLIVVGGGVLGDMGGFCAGTYKRGIDFILVPTTLLAQVDASIGGKLGIDFNNFKNHIGIFQTPVQTILFSGFLTTLPFQEKRSGFAEVIKHSLISDQAMWEIVSSRSLEDQPWDVLIRHSVEFKLRVVTEDPKETGLRKILNAGHTIGHALESYLLSAGRKVMHGEAVAAGLIAEAFIASSRGMLSDKEFSEIRRYVFRIFGKLTFNENEDDAISRLVIQDKKNLGNKILCVLLEAIGRARIDCEISLDEVKQALQFYRADQM